MPEVDSPVQVAVIQRVIPGYRVPVFEALGASDGVELTVYHGSNPRELARGNTDDPGGESFTRVQLPTVAAQVFGLHLVWFRGLLGRVRSDPPDVVVGPASPSLLTVVVLALYARLAGIGFVWWGKSLGSKASVSPVGALLQALGDAFRHPLFRSADACVCYSTAAAEYFQSYGVPEEDVFVAYNSTDTSLMRELEAQYRADESVLDSLGDSYEADDRDVVFFVGTHTSEKNIENLIDAHELLLERGHPTSLVIAGSGPQTDSLRAYAEDLPAVSFVGRIPDAELVQHFMIADVFAMPGHGGLAVQQAMTLGLPVVTTPLDGTEQDLVDEGENGFLVESDDVGALADGLERVLEAAPDERDAMGCRSREIVDETVNIDRMIDGFRGAIEAASGKPLSTVGR